MELFSILDTAKVSCSESYGCEYHRRNARSALGQSDRQGAEPDPDVEANAGGGPTSSSAGQHQPLDRCGAGAASHAAPADRGLADSGQRGGADADLSRQADSGRRTDLDSAGICAGAHRRPLVAVQHTAGPSGALLAVSMLVGALGFASYASYSRALDFMQELPKYKARIQALGAKIREQAEQIEKTTETVLPQNPETTRPSPSSSRAAGPTWSAGMPTPSPSSCWRSPSSRSSSFSC